jgi:acetyltransferase-like isoleucine patch superfamily enzyme
LEAFSDLCDDLGGLHVECHGVVFRHAGTDQARQANDLPGHLIGEDCWLGANSIVLKGVTIGDRSVVAAGSVVTADIGEDCLAAGNPTRVVRSFG